MAATKKQAMLDYARAYVADRQAAREADPEDSDEIGQLVTLGGYSASTRG